LISGGVHDVTVNQPVGSFKDSTDLRDASIEQLGLAHDLQSVGENIMFVIPKGTQQSVVANAGIGWFVSTFSDKWINDLRATVHERGT
jgi:hypothetical protein